jgi:hypothetical protein
MGVRINPCFGCLLREGCAQRDDFRRRASGLGARSVTFDCPILAERIAPGVRITITAPVLDTGYGWDGSEHVKMFTKNLAATITSVQPGHRFACVVDPDQLDPDEVQEGKDVNVLRFRKTQRHTRIRAFRDEPRATICDFGNVKRPDGCDFRRDLTSEDRCGCEGFGCGSSLASLP